MRDALQGAALRTGRERHEGDGATDGAEPVRTTAGAKAAGGLLDRLSFVFILSYGRSGSTILAKLLNVHDGVLVRGENLNLAFRLMQAVSASEDMRAFGPEGRPDTPDRPWFGNRAGDPSAFSRALAEAFVAHILRPAPETRLLGFKEIRTLPAHMKESEFRRYVSLLLTVFPESRIIFNSRDMEAVIRSGWWAEKPAEESRAAVLAADARFAAAAARHERAIHVRHEETVGSPEARAAIIRFLGLEPDEARMARALRRPLTHAKGRLQMESTEPSVDRKGGRE